MIKMQLEHWKKVAILQAEIAHHIANVKTKKWAIRDYKRCTAPDKEEMIEQSKRSLDDSKQWLKNIDHHWKALRHN